MASQTVQPTRRSGAVAIVHDYLTQRGGAERVALELARMWPDAPIYTSMYRPKLTFPEFAGHQVHGSYLDFFPIHRGFRNLFPLYPSAFRALGELDHDLVVSSSSGWAHGVRTSRQSTHVVYCHTPARWLYGYDYLGPRSAKQLVARPLLGAMRHWDARAARRADLYIANSRHVRDRIQAVYGREAEVVHPPVDVDRFRARPRGERLLLVSRLLPYKRIDLAIQAANRGRLPLDVIGSGPAYGALKELAGPTVRFDRRLEDAAITELMEGCRALILPGVEDFGITPVEALAAGKPVVAFADGGALETLDEGVNAALFREPTVEGLLEALRRADQIDTAPEAIARGALRFSPAAFRAGIRSAIERVRRGEQPRRCLSRLKAPGPL